MTTTANGHRPTVTGGGDVRVRAHVVETPVRVDPRPEQPKTPRITRVIPGGDRTRKVSGKIRDFASLHAGLTGNAVRSSWPLTESPDPLATVAKGTFPAKGEAPNAGVWMAMAMAGMFRIAVFAAAQLIQLSVATRLRAGVGLAFFVLAVGASVIAAVL